MSVHIMKDLNLNAVWMDDISIQNGLGDDTLPDSVDVAIIGSGYTGLSAALYLAKKGVSVAVLEKEYIGWGASSRNAGKLVIGQKASAPTLFKRYGNILGKKLWDTAVEGVDLVEDIIKNENIHTKLNFVAEFIGLNIIGFVGYGFLKDYEFSINYDKQILTLQRIDEKGNTLRSEQTTFLGKKTTIDFQNNNEINIPEVVVQICGQNIPAFFDTGSQGGIRISERQKDSLLLKNCINETKGIHYGLKKDSITTIQFHNISIQENNFGRLNNLLLTKGDSQLTLGYSFLKNYISVWNYKKKTIQLIETNK